MQGCELQWLKGCDLQPLSGRDMLPEEAAVPIQGGSGLFSFPSTAKSDRDCESEPWTVLRSPSVE